MTGKLSAPRCQKKVEFLGGLTWDPSWEGDDQHVEMVLKKTGLAGGKPPGRLGER